MTSPAEDALYAALWDVDSLETLSKVGLEAEAIPTVEMRQVVEWALERFFESGRKQAPTRELLLSQWAATLEEADVVLPGTEEEVDTIESAIAALQDHLIKLRWQKFLQEHGPAVVSATPVERRDALNTAASTLYDLVEAVTDHTNEMDSSQGFAVTVAEYEQRVRDGNKAQGLAFGFKEIDQHTFGIHPGELAVAAAGPKVGKSFLMVWVARQEFLRGRRVVLFTLENSVEMTWQRLACAHFGLSQRAFQRGEVLPEKIEEVKGWIADGFGDNLVVLQPEPGQRSVTALVRKARTLGAESLLIDQLSHIELPDALRKAQHEVVYEIVHGLKRQISSGREKMSCLLAHQINREGVKKAEKEGFYDLTNLAGSSGVERAADWVFGFNQSQVQRAQREMTWQTMAARREDIKHWDLSWNVDKGGAHVVGEVALGS